MSRAYGTAIRDKLLLFKGMNMSQFDKMSRLNIVLNNIKNQCQEDEDDLDVYLSEINSMLDDLYENDFFGTEGSSDPRGDQRNGIFTMHNVEGFDD